jgi:hypothetical protein
MFYYLIYLVFHISLSSDQKLLKNKCSTSNLHEKLEENDIKSTLKTLGVLRKQRKEHGKNYKVP